MKKIASMILALVLVSSFSATAFAADGEEIGNSRDFTTGTASTEVNLKFSSDASQLSASVPLSVTLAVKKDMSLAAPDATAYKISNTGPIPFHVSDISVATETNYALVTTAPASAGDIKLTLAAGSDDIALAASSSPSQQVIAAPAQWNVAPSNNLGLTLKNGSVFSIGDWTSATKVFTITYTIAAGVA